MRVLEATPPPGILQLNNERRNNETICLLCKCFVFNILNIIKEISICSERTCYFRYLLK